MRGIGRGRFPGHGQSAPFSQNFQRDSRRRPTAVLRELLAGKRDGVTACSNNSEEHGIERRFGVHAEGPIEKPSEVRPAIERALKFVKEKKLPALVDVVSEPC